jgi:hypothetical protein
MAHVVRASPPDGRALLSAFLSLSRPLLDFSLSGLFEIPPSGRSNAVPFGAIII